MRRLVVALLAAAAGATLARLAFAPPAHRRGYERVADTVSVEIKTGARPQWRPVMMNV